MRRDASCLLPSLTIQGSLYRKSEDSTKEALIVLPEPGNAGSLSQNEVRVVVRICGGTNGTLFVCVLFSLGPNKGFARHVRCALR